MMILAIDSGNTLLKLGIYDHEKVVERFQLTAKEEADVLKHIAENFDIKAIVVAIVGQFEKEILKAFFPLVLITEISHQSLFPFENTYETPHTLGIDRMVLSAGAVLSFPNKNRLIIDVGSCITYDFVNDKDQFLGGAISPGVEMRYAVLHEKTAKLPLIKAAHFDQVIGKSTQTAIHSGVMTAILFEINGYISHFSQEHENFIIILTGGGSKFFAKPLKSLIFAEPNFLMDSLVKLFNFQTKK